MVTSRFYLTNVQTRIKFACSIFYNKYFYWTISFDLSRKHHEKPDILWQMSWCPGSPNRNTFFFPTHACVVRMKSDKNHSGKGEKPLSTSYISLFFSGRVGGKVKFSPFGKLESLFLSLCPKNGVLGCFWGHDIPTLSFSLLLTACFLSALR